VEPPHGRQAPEALSVPGLRMTLLNRSISIGDPGLAGSRPLTSAPGRTGALRPDVEASRTIQGGAPGAPVRGREVMLMTVSWSLRHHCRMRDEIMTSGVGRWRQAVIYRKAALLL
jgi:hypothetical protein